MDHHPRGERPLRIVGSEVVAPLARPGDGGPDEHAPIDLAREGLRQQDGLVERTTRIPWVRLSVGAVAIAGLSVLPVIGVAMPPYAWMLIAGVIAVGTILSARGERRALGLDESGGEAGPDGSATDRHRLQGAREDDGVPVGCCPGPRPMRALRDGL